MLQIFSLDKKNKVNQLSSRFVYEDKNNKDMLKQNIIEITKP